MGPADKTSFFWLLSARASLKNGQRDPTNTKPTSNEKNIFVHNQTVKAKAKEYNMPSSKFKYISFFCTRR